MELIEGLTLDVELSEKVESNYMAVLHWYGNDGAHRKLDIRRAIRKSLRKVCTLIQAYLHTICKLNVFCTSSTSKCLSVIAAGNSWSCSEKGVGREGSLVDQDDGERVSR